MKIPDCYEAFYQEDRRQKAWDAYMARLPVCVICGERLYNGDEYHESGGKVVCGFCMDDLNEKLGIVEVN